MAGPSKQHCREFRLVYTSAALTAMYEMHFIDDCLGRVFSMTSISTPTTHSAGGSSVEPVCIPAVLVAAWQRQPGNLTSTTVSVSRTTLCDPNQPRSHSNRVNLQQQQQQKLRLPPADSAVRQCGGNRGQRNGNAKHSFTPEEDEIILERVRQTPHKSQVV